MTTQTSPLGGADRPVHPGDTTKGFPLTTPRPQRSNRMKPSRGRRTFLPVLAGLLCLLALHGGAAWGLPRELFLIPAKSGGENLNVRSEPSTKGEKVGILSKGDGIIVDDRRETGEEFPWYKTVFPVQGWVYGKYVQFNNEGYSEEGYNSLWQLSMRMSLDFGDTPEKMEAAFGKPLKREEITDKNGLRQTVLRYPGFVASFATLNTGIFLSALTVAPGNDQVSFGPWRIGGNSRTLTELVASYDGAEGAWNLFNDDYTFLFTVEKGFISGMAYRSKELSADYLPEPQNTLRRDKNPSPKLPISRIPDLHRHGNLVHGTEFLSDEVSLVFRTLEKKGRGAPPASALFNGDKTLSAAVDHVTLDGSLLGGQFAGAVSFDQVTVRNTKTGEAYGIHCPELLHRPLENLIWYGNRYLLFDVAMSAGRGVHFVVDALERTEKWIAATE